MGTPLSPNSSKIMTPYLLSVLAMWLFTACAGGSEQQTPTNGGQQPGPDGGVEEALSCIELHHCLLECSPTDQACANICYGQGSPEANGLLSALYDCIDAQCGGHTGPSLQACVEDLCGVSYLICGHHGDPRVCGSYARCAQIRCDANDYSCYRQCFAGAPQSCKDCISGAEHSCIESACSAEKSALDNCVSDFGCDNRTCVETNCPTETNALDGCFAGNSATVCAPHYDPCY